MSDAPFVHGVRIYYEDTDHSGMVYHANYLRYMERAREHVLDPSWLVQLWNEAGVGFVVYKAELTYREPARFGDELEVRTTIRRESDWRAIFRQDIYRRGGATPLVEGLIHLVAVDRAGKLTRLPAEVG
jgi:tol-pal system-associated acyl-CoA thioesterase